MQESVSEMYDDAEGTPVDGDDPFPEDLVIEGELVDNDEPENEDDYECQE